MTKSGGWKHLPETRAKIAQTQRARWDETARAATSEVTKARMADPAVRQRIRDGMRRASGEADELRAIEAAWRSARPAVRPRFISQTFTPVCSASASPAEDENG